MDIVAEYWGVLVGVWGKLPDDVRYYTWAGTGLALGVGFLIWWHAWFRRLLGYRKHRGTWYTEKQYAELMQILDESSKVRVLLHADMVALRQWKHGDVKAVFGDNPYGGYF